MEEIWKPVVGCEGRYEVSNLGNIRSLNYKGTGIVSILKQYKNKDGYMILSLGKRGNIKSASAHKKVLEAFIPNPENKSEVNHKNGVKHDNRIENLEWSTRKENQQHAWDTGLMKNHHSNEWKGKYGKYNPTSRIVFQYTKDLEFIKEWDSMMDAQRELGILQTSISACCRGKLNHTGGYVWRYELLPINN